MSELAAASPIPAVLWTRSGASATQPTPQPAAAEELVGSRLLLLLHGLGADERDLLPIAPLLPEGLLIASLGAPLPWGSGRAWFPIEAPGDPAQETVRPATEAILDWLGALPATPMRIDALGFSQGGAMVTQLLRHDPGLLSAGVVLSGFSLGGAPPGDAVLAGSQPPVFWGWDPADPVIPPAAFARTGQWLRAHSALTERRYPGIGHGISAAEIADVAEFLST